MSELKKKYLAEVIPELKKKFEYKNVHMIPKLQKIVINCCNKEVLANSKMVDNIMEDLTQISGQKPVVAKAKKSIASFKQREGQPLGAFVTLRGVRMYDFLERLVGISLPRVRDFRGVNPKGFDGNGNYNLGLKDQILFPEIDYNKIDKIRGMNITFVTSATTNQEARELLQLLGMPFAK